MISKTDVRAFICASHVVGPPKIGLCSAHAQHSTAPCDTIPGLSRGRCGSYLTLFPVILCVKRYIILSKALGRVGMDLPSGAVLLEGSCVSSSFFISSRAYFCRVRTPLCSVVHCAASKGLSDQTARSRQDRVPLVDAVRAAGDVNTVYPFHIPGHKVSGHASLQIRSQRIARRLGLLIRMHGAEGPWSSRGCQGYHWAGDS